MSSEEIICSIALTQVPGVGVVWARNLLKIAGSASAVFGQRAELTKLMPGIPKRIVDALDSPEPLVRAEKEYEFTQKNGIQCLSINDKRYPSRLRECDDAPVVLFFKGNAELNARRILSIVGTRNITEYGKQACKEFLNDLKQVCPDVLVISGLAYGVDIHAHRAALANELPTVGVLAHGLDRIYPAVHRKTAIDMLAGGGLLTEFLTGNAPDKYNFVSRNRIVAGMSDATIVVESAVKGGSLITAEIANGYNRDCFAFPGRSTDELSKGCNALIRDSKAALIQSAGDFVNSIGWLAPASPAITSKQQTFFPDLSEEEQSIVFILQAEGASQINSLIVESNIPVHKVNTILFELEMKGIVRTLAGGMYQLLK